MVRAQGGSQAEAGLAAGVEQRTVSDWERDPDFLLQTAEVRDVLQETFEAGAAEWSGLMRSAMKEGKVPMQYMAGIGKVFTDTSVKLRGYKKPMPWDDRAQVLTAEQAREVFDSLPDDMKGRLS